MKQIELARQLKITKGAVTSWKRKNKIPPARVFEISKILNVTADELNQDNDLLFNIFKENKNEQK